MNRRELLKTSFALAFVAPLAGNNLVQASPGSVGSETDANLGETITAPDLNIGDTLQSQYDIHDESSGELLLRCHLFLTVTHIGSNGVKFNVSKKLEEFVPLRRVRDE